jgi:hypothetical protein
MSVFPQNLEEGSCHEEDNVAGCALKKIVELCLRVQLHAELVPARERNGLATSSTNPRKSLLRTSTGG